MLDEHRINVDLLLQTGEKVFDIHGLEVYPLEQVWLLTNKHCVVHASEGIEIIYHVGHAVKIRVNKHGFHYWLTFQHGEHKKHIRVICKNRHVKLITKLNFSHEDAILKS